MRYQLPDGMTSISAEGLSFEADVDGMITVGADVGPAVHTALQSPMLWGLKPEDEVEAAALPTQEAEAAAETAQPTEQPGPIRENKKNLLTLLRGLGYVLDGRATFEFLRRKAIAALNELDPAVIAATAPPVAVPVAPAPELEPAAPEPAADLAGAAQTTAPADAPVADTPAEPGA